MAANGYFQVVAEDGRMWLKIFAPEEGEVDISPEMVMKYLDAISFPDYDQVALDQYLKRKEFDSMFMLYEGEIIPERIYVNSEFPHWLAEQLENKIGRAHV